jgi:hypothetical protein
MNAVNPPSLRFGGQSRHPSTINRILEPTQKRYN